jgi:adenosylcobyric acid synthase
VGKSVIAAAFCRIFSNQGFRVAPFKAQNMALNSFVTADGAEVSRAQALQAEAARIPLQVEMNPVLLKPNSEIGAQVIVMGKVVGTMAAKEYQAYKTELWPVVEKAYRRLAEQVDVIVIEGAGSPAEINLKPYDIVNMRIAEMANAAVLLVGDIDRGGVFASLLGTVQWLTPQERQRVAGFLINKFRGDLSLLAPGIEAMTERTGLPVLGVIPYVPDFRLDEEDSVSLENVALRGPADESDTRLRVGVLRFPRLSNFTDLDPLESEPGLSISYAVRPSDFKGCRVVVLPGSKNTVEDLAWLRRQGFESEIRELYATGAHVVGLCGGYQMLGMTIEDPHHVESPCGSVEGLGLLAVDTILERTKQTVRIACEPVGPWVCEPHVANLRSLFGYEIHMGRTVRRNGCLPALRIHQRQGRAVDEEEGARTADGRLWGTYAHGLFENDRFRQCLISRWKAVPCGEATLSYAAHRQASLERWASVVLGSVDMRAVDRLIQQ